jgi:hypothetical protein
VSGVTEEKIRNTGPGFRNICQLITVDDAKAGEIYAFDEIRAGDDKDLTMTITKEHTYHFLFLTGRQQRDWSVMNGAADAGHGKRA